MGWKMHSQLKIPILQLDYFILDANIINDS